MKNYREIAENVLERRDRYLEMRRRRKLTAIKTVSSVMGIAVAGCLSITVYNNSTIQNIKPEQNNSSYNVNDYTKPAPAIITTPATYTTSEAHTTVSKPMQTTSVAVCTENTSTAAATTESHVIPTATTVHTATTVYYVPEYTSAIMTFVPETYFTSALETHDTYTTATVTATTLISTYPETAGTVPVTRTTLTSVVWTSDIFTEETTQTTGMPDENVTSTETSTMTDIQSYATSLRSESAETVPTEIPETFVFFTTTDYRKFSDTENTTTTVA